MNKTKMGHESKQRALNQMRMQSDEKHFKIFNIFNQQGNTNENNFETSSSHSKKG